MINDRGSKKWTSLMLPEHLEILKGVFAEQDYEEKPVLDKQQMRENELTLQQAIHEQLVIEIKHFENNAIHRVKGKVSSIVDDYLWIDNQRICLKNIIEIYEV